MKLKHNPALTPAAQELRKNMTPQEKHLWYDFLCTYPVRILRQKVIHRFIVDFYCSEAKLVIELDGSQHYTGNGPAYDAERTKILEGYGLRVIRFSNDDVDQHFAEVCMEIDRQIKNNLSYS